MPLVPKLKNLPVQRRNNGTTLFHTERMSNKGILSKETIILLLISRLVTPSTFSLSVKIKKKVVVEKEYCATHAEVSISLMWLRHSPSLVTQTFTLEKLENIRTCSILYYYIVNE